MAQQEKLPNRTDQLVAAVGRNSDEAGCCCSKEKGLKTSSAVSAISFTPRLPVSSFQGFLAQRTVLPFDLPPNPPPLLLASAAFVHHIVKVAFSAPLAPLNIMMVVQAGKAAAPPGSALLGRSRGCRVARRPRGGVPVQATASFEELRATASEAVASAQSKLPLLEQAKTTAERAREPAADAERVWQEAHARLTGLQQEAASTMKALRDGVTAAAGGEAGATHALLERHVAERLEYYRVNHNLVTASDWKVGRAGQGAAPVQDPEHFGTPRFLAQKVPGWL